tara:strand:- start:3294 stop:3620 length:327 start_codon:yes stop_codon:yes gene_type:complete
MKESQISKEIRDLCKGIGFAVYSTEQGYRRERGGTRQTPGIPDLLIFGRGIFFFVEVKTPKGKLRDSQVAFSEECAACDPPVHYLVWRDVRDAFDWFVEMGIIKASNQ